jgi:hypothetical protein
MYTLVIKIDKPIPNDVGLVEVAPGASRVRFRLYQYDSRDGRQLSQTDRLVVTYDETRAPAKLKPVSSFTQNLPLAAKVYLASHRPLRPAVGTDLSLIEFQLQQIQLNQIRNSP